MIYDEMIEQNIKSLYLAAKRANTSSIKEQEKGIFKWIHKDNITINNVYQRDQLTRRKLSLLKRIIQEFEWSKFGTITVREIGKDQYECIDGGGRLTVANVIDDIQTVPCIIYSIDTEKDAADLFLDISMDRVSMVWYDRYKAGLIAGRTEFVRMKEFATKIGRKIRQSTSPNNISCISALYKITISDSSYEALICIADEIGLFFLDETFSGVIFEALFYSYRYCDNKSAFLERLSKRNPNEASRYIKSYISKHDLDNSVHIRSKAFIELLNKGYTRNLIKIIPPRDSWKKDISKE